MSGGVLARLASPGLLEVGMWMWSGEAGRWAVIDGGVLGARSWISNMGFIKSSCPVHSSLQRRDALVFGLLGCWFLMTVTPTGISRATEVRASLEGWLVCCQLS